MNDLVAEGRLQRAVIGADKQLDVVWLPFVTRSSVEAIGGNKPEMNDGKVPVTIKCISSPRAKVDILQSFLPTSCLSQALCFIKTGFYY